MKTILLALISFVGLSAQTLSITGPANLRAGSTAMLNVSLASGGNANAGLQFNLLVGPDIAAVTPAIGPAASGASKNITCSPLAAAKLTCIIFGINLNTIPDGVVATFSVTLAANPVATPEAFSLAGLVAGGPSGTTLPIAAGAALVIPVQSKCDVTGDNVVNGLDVIALASWAVGISSPPAGVNADLNGDGKVDLLDLLTLVPATQPGGACNAN